MNLTNNKTLLICGGAGYIGSHTNLACIAQGYNTIVFDNLEYGHKEFIPEGCEFIKGDLRNPDDIEEVFKTHKIDGVIHFAAYLQVGESVSDPEKYYYNNVVGTLNLLHAMKKHDVKSIVFSSTAATYGLHDIDKITETCTQSPINPYGQSKLTVEHILKEYHSAYGLKSFALRYFNASGADVEARVGEDHSPETHLIPLVLDAAMGRRDFITIFGTDYNTPDGTCIRDYIHVNDLASAHIKAIEYLEHTSVAEQCNVATGHGFSVKEIIETAKKVTGKNIPIKIGERRPGDPDILVADSTKLQTMLGWKPEYSDIETIISTAWNWHQKRFGDHV